MGRSRAGTPGIDGVCIIDKEPTWTSHDVVAKSRGILGTKKVGHSGTLDPDATGLLVLGVGKATRLLSYLTALPKTYTGEIVLGTETSSLDASGEVTATYTMDGVTVEQVRAAAATLTGDILQVPPMVSAIQIDGKRLHELAREGKEVERPARPVTVYRFEILDEIESNPGVYRCEVECSSGTYIRSLAADVGTALGGGAHLRNLRRTAVGGFTEADAVSLGDLTLENLRPVASAVGHLIQLTVDDEVAADVRFGKVLERARIGVDAEADGPWAVLTTDGELLAVYAPFRGSTVKPAVVIP